MNGNWYDTNFFDFWVGLSSSLLNELRMNHTHVGNSNHEPHQPEKGKSYSIIYGIIKLDKTLEENPILD